MLGDGAAGGFPSRKAPKAPKAQGAWWGRPRPAVPAVAPAERGASATWPALRYRTGGAPVTALRCRDPGSAGSPWCRTDRSGAGSPATGPLGPGGSAGAEPAEAAEADLSARRRTGGARRSGLPARQTGTEHRTVAEVLRSGEEARRTVSEAPPGAARDRLPGGGAAAHRVHRPLDDTRRASHHPRPALEAGRSPAGVSAVARSRTSCRTGYRTKAKLAHPWAGDLVLTGKGQCVA